MIDFIIFMILFAAMQQWGGLTVFLYAFGYLVVISALTIFMDTNDAG